MFYVIGSEALTKKRKQNRTTEGDRFNRKVGEVQRDEIKDALMHGRRAHNRGKSRR